MNPKSLERAEKILNEIWPRQPHSLESGWKAMCELIAEAIDEACAEAHDAGVLEEREQCAKILEPMLEGELKFASRADVQYLINRIRQQERK